MAVLVLAFSLTSNPRTAIHFDRFAEELKKDGIHLILSGVHTQPLYALTQYGLFDKIGEQNIYGNIDDALDRARELLGMPKLGRPKEFIPVVKREMKNK